MKKNNNAYAGRNVEALIKDSISNQPNVISKIKQKFNIKGELDNTSGAGIYGEKTDVRLSFSCGHYVDANIKGYKAGFNQLARTSVSKFCKDFKLDDNDKKELEEIVISKSQNPRNPLFSDKQQKKWGDFFKKNAKALLKLGFSTNPSREILVLYDRNTSVVKIYAIKDVLAKLSKEITFTNGGFNIGECVSFQRKGGNGFMSRTIPKTNIKHPGNNIQLKLKIHRMIRLLKDIKLAEYVL
jgi:hypothetical protein